LFSTGVQKSAAECPNGWTRFNDSCYFFGHHDVTFLEATVSSSVASSFIVSYYHGYTRIKDSYGYITNNR
jgi:hypothetical protein